MPLRNSWNGFVLAHLNRGIKAIEIHANGSHTDIWIDNELADDIPTDNKWADYLADEYGNTFFETMDDYPSKPLYITDIQEFVDG